MGLVEVVDTKSENMARFSDLDLGETFRYDGQIYLKFSMLCMGQNAFSFQNNIPSDFGPKCCVTRVNCKLIVEG